MAQSPVVETILAQKYSYEIEKFKSLIAENNESRIRSWFKRKFRKVNTSNVSPVVLVVGAIGTGKTDIAKILYRYAMEKQHKGIWIDWQDERKKYPEWFIGTGYSVEHLLNIIYAGLRDKFPKGCFKRYEDVAQLVHNSEKKVSAEIEASQSWVEPIAALAKLSGVAAGSVRNLLSSSPVGPIYALIPDELKDAASEAVSTSVRSAVESVAKSVLNKKEYQAYVNGTELLCNALATDIQQATRQQACTIVLDHSELVTASFPWLRHLVKQTGNKILWIVTTQPQPGVVEQFRNDVVLAEKLIDCSVNPLSIKEIEDVVRSYFSQNRSATPGEIRALYAATQGNIIALTVALQVWSPNSQIDVNTLLYTGAHHNDIVSSVFHNYVQSLNADESTQLVLLTSSFLYYFEPELLAYVLDGTDASAKISVLPVQYPFLYDVDGRLTSYARYWFREQFFKSHQNRALDTVKSRALEWWANRLKSLNDEGSLLNQIKSPQWSQATLAVIYHSFWQNSTNAGLELMKALTSMLLLPEAELLVFVSAARETLGPLYITQPRQQHIFNLFQWAIVRVISDEDIDVNTSFSTQQHEIEAIRQQKVKEIIAWGTRHRQEAFDEYEKAVHDNELHLLALKIHKARFLAIEGKYEDAFAVLMSISGSKNQQNKTKNNLLGRGFTNLANVVLESGASPSLAVRCFDQALALLGDNAWLHHMLSEAHFRDLQYEETLRCADKAISLDPEYTSAYCSKARAQHQLRMWDESFKTYEQALSLAKNPRLRALILTNMAVNLIDLGRLEDGEAKVDEALHTDSSYAFAHIQKIRLERAKHPERVLNHLERAIEYLDSVQDAHVDMILSLLASQTDDTAIKILEGMLTKEKQIQFFNYKVLATVKFELGNRYFAKSRWRDALLQYQQALSIYPRFQPAQYQLMKVFVKMGRQQEAAEQGLKLWQSDLHFLYRIEEHHLVLLSQVSARQLEKDNKKRSGVQKKDAIGYIERAYMELIQQNWEKARSLMLIAYKADPDAWLTHMGLAAIEMEMRNYEVAERHAKELVVRLKEGFRGIAYHWLGEVYVQQDAYEKAIEAYELALKDYQLAKTPSQSARAQLSLELGFCYVSLGDQERAAQYFKEAYYLDPNESAGQLGHIITLMQAGNTLQADIDLTQMARSSQWEQRLNRVKENAKNSGVARYYESFVKTTVIKPLLLGAMITGNRTLFDELVATVDDKDIMGIDLNGPLIQNSPVDWSRLLPQKRTEKKQAA